jgi:ribosomal protein S21
MLIIKIEKNDSIDKALKVLKNKVIKTKQNNILFERKEYKKKSVVYRSKILKAIYIQKKKGN